MKKKSATDLNNLESVHRPRRCPYCGIDSVDAQTQYRRYLVDTSEGVSSYILLTISFDCFCKACERSYDISPDDIADLETTREAFSQWAIV